MKLTFYLLKFTLHNKKLAAIVIHSVAVFYCWVQILIEVRDSLISFTRDLDGYVELPR